MAKNAVISPAMIEAQATIDEYQQKVAYEKAIETELQTLMDTARKAEQAFWLDLYQRDPDLVEEQARFENEIFDRYELEKTSLDFARAATTTVKDLALAQTVNAGATVKSTDGKTMVVYYGGKVSWDNKKLEGLAIVYPDLLKARTVGNPYAVLR